MGSKQYAIAIHVSVSAPFMGSDDLIANLCVLESDTGASDVDLGAPIAD